MRVDLSGMDTATLPDGTVFNGPGCCCRAARHLIEGGADPATILTAYRDGKPAMTGHLAAFAGKMWGGKERDPALVAYKPVSLGSVRPQAALEEIA